jgi:Major Facilitator Superfamily
VAEVRSGDLVAALDDASLSRFHLRAVLVSGMGFFTDAYDLFVIGIASTLIAREWHLSSSQLALLNSTMLAAAFLGAMVFGRFADLAGRKRVYWLVAVIMVVAALGSALSPSFWVLIAFRFLLGFGVGGDYPVSVRRATPQSQSASVVILGEVGGLPIWRALPTSQLPRRNDSLPKGTTHHRNTPAPGEWRLRAELHRMTVRHSQGCPQGEGDMRITFRQAGSMQPR